MKFSANLGFLWNELTLPEAIRAAKKSGFEAVECHWPYDTDPDEINKALAETGLKMLGLNTSRGDVKAGENGLSALPGREQEARQAIDQAIEYAVSISAKNIHVMAGFSSGESAHAVFIDNLSYACRMAKPYGITILIEPLNSYDAPDYFLTTCDQAKNIINAVGMDNLRLMFDCYHIQVMEGDVTRRLKMNIDIVGHVQIASVPYRMEPDSGELNYHFILSELSEIGYTGALGAEYKPKYTTDQGLGWMNSFNLNTDDSK